MVWYYRLNVLQQTSPKVKDFLVNITVGEPDELVAKHWVSRRVSVDWRTQTEERPSRISLQSTPEETGELTVELFFFHTL